MILMIFKETSSANFLKKLDKKEFFIILLIFVLAFAIRAHLMIYELFFEFDTYFHARMAEFIIQNFSLPTYDWMAYYQLDKPALPITQGPFFWIFTATIYKVFTLGLPYNKALWIGFVKILPALFGALTVVAVYFLGKEIYDKKTGIVMAFFAAVVPAYVYRTMAGQFEEDSLGFLWMVIGFVFFVRALKVQEFNKKAIGFSLASGIFFGLMAWTWEMFLLIPMIMVGYTTLMIILMWFKNQEKKEIFNFVKICAITFFCFSLLAVLLVGTGWMKRTTDYVTQYAPVTPDNINRASQKGEGVLAVTVGEENLGHPFWFDKYNALIVFPFLALVLLPFKALKRNDKYGLILFVWLAITIFMAFNKLKFTYTLGIPLAFSAGIVFNEIVLFSKNRTPLEKKSLLIAFGFFVLIGVAAGDFFVTRQVPSIESEPGWKETLYWLRDNTPDNSKIFNWWDDGHHVAFIAERRPLIDNRNLDLQADSDYALFILAESEDEAYNLVKKYGSDYVIVKNRLLASIGSMGVYAYNTTNFSDPRITKYSAIIFNCNKNNENVFSCGNNNLNETQMNSLPVQWVSQPNQLIENKVPGFVYTTQEKDYLVLFNQATNSTFGARLWFNDPSIKHFEEVYQNKQVKVFKVIN